MYLATVDWAMSIPSFSSAVNPRRTPQRVVAADCSDQIADVGRDRGPADTTARLPTPVQTEAAPMPAHQRLGLEDNRGFAHGREQPIEPDEDQAICSAHPEPRWRRPLQDNKLLAEKCCFGLPSRMRSEQSDEQSAEQLQEVKHPEARITHRGICASPDTISGSHRTGLGLSISYDIVTQEHGGTISVDSQVGEFTEFTIRLPRAYGATIAEAAR